MPCIHYKILYFLFWVSYQISIIDTSLNFTWYRIGKEISGIAHHYSVHLSD